MDTSFEMKVRFKWINIDIDKKNLGLRIGS